LAIGLGQYSIRNFDKISETKSTIGSPQSAIGRPTRYREVVLTSWEPF